MQSLILSASIVLAACLVCHAQSPPNLNEVPHDIALPSVERVEPAAGKRVVATTAAWAGSEVHHLIYLPSDWTPDKNWPVIVEYPGNGGFKNALGDTSDGSVEGCVLGYGLSAGQGFIWVSMPFVEASINAPKRNAVKWWGDVAETKRYCIATVQEVCTHYHGDAKRVILAGFSRGAIACNYIGLNDDAISPLWCAFFCHSHYDGVREGWGYVGADRASALQRLKRLGNRPQWISHEGNVEATQAYLQSTGIAGRFTFNPLPYPNHSAAWTLCDLPLRAKARAWLHEVVGP